MPAIGFHASHEQHAPTALLNLVLRAEAAGFTEAMCSDHFAPWLPRQGQSGFTWSWLGAALQATAMTFGTVCAPGQRYHPAVLAQAVATLGEMFPGRLWVALGSGEALNESITGGPWPSKDIRNRRLRECTDIMRALWAGETVTHHGLVQVKGARLYSRPAQSPLLLGAALTPETARWMGGWADGLITAAGAGPRVQRVVDAFREGGGADKPLCLQVAVSYAETDDECIRVAHEHWRQAALPAALLADLETPLEFERVSKTVEPRDLLDSVRASADTHRHLAWLAEDIEMGFTRIYVHNVNPDHTRFFDELAPGALALAGGRNPATHERRAARQ